MMNSRVLHWVLRCIIASLFIVSAISKLYPVEAFEKQLVDLGFATWCNAPIFARAIIAFELYLGIGFLQNHFFKKFIIPATVGLLLAFIAHLSYQIINFGNTGNCGCMGQLIPMTPVEAIIKNIISILIILFIYKNAKDKPDSKHRYHFLLLAAIAAFILMKYKMQCCCDPIPNDTLTYTIPDVPIATEELVSSGNVISSTTSKDTNSGSTLIIPSKTAKINAKDSVKKPNTPPVKRSVSEFARYTQFSDGKITNVDEGKTIMCVFNTMCDHCMDAAKAITELSKKKSIPKVRIIFWSENNSKGEDLQKEIDAFFKYAGASYPYTVVDIGTFFRILGKTPSPPRVVYLNEGNTLLDIGGEEFNIEALSKAIQ